MHTVHHYAFAVVEAKNPFFSTRKSTNSSKSKVKNLIILTSFFFESILTKFTVHFNQNLFNTFLHRGDT